METYCIALPKRILQCKKLEKCLNLKFTYTPVTLKENLNISDLINSGIVSNSKLRAGEIACFLSHRTVWEIFLSTSKSVCLILEDDNQIPEDGEKVMRKINEISETSGWNLVNLSPCWSSKCKYHGMVEIDSYCLNAYMLSRKGARELLMRTQVIDKPVDHYLKISQSFELQPRLLSQIDFQTHIGNGDALACVENNTLNRKIIRTMLSMKVSFLVIVIIVVLIMQIYTIFKTGICLTF